MVLPLLLARCESKRGERAVRITIHQDDKLVTLKIDGRIADSLVDEFQRAWQELESSLGSKRLSLDLCGVTFLGTTARKLLAEIQAKTGADIIADRPLTKYYAEEAMSGIRIKSQGRMRGLR